MLKNVFVTNPLAKSQVNLVPQGGGLGDLGRWIIKGLRLRLVSSVTVHNVRQGSNVIELTPLLGIHGHYCTFYIVPIFSNELACFGGPSQTEPRWRKHANINVLFLNSPIKTNGKCVQPYFFLMLRLRFFSIWLRLLCVSDWIWVLRLFCSLLKFHTCQRA